MVYRVDTQLGQPPASCDPTKDANVQTVQYTAKYCEPYGFFMLIFECPIYARFMCRLLLKIQRSRHFLMSSRVLAFSLSFVYRMLYVVLSISFSFWFLGIRVVFGGSPVQVAILWTLATYT